MAPDPKTVGEAFGWLYDDKWTMTMSDTGEAAASPLCECGRMVEAVKRADGRGWRAICTPGTFVYWCCVRTSNELVSSMTKGDRAMDLTDDQVEDIRRRLASQISAPAVETLAAIEELQRKRQQIREQNAAILDYAQTNQSLRDERNSLEKEVSEFRRRLSEPGRDQIFDAKVRGYQDATPGRVSREFAAARIKVAEDEMRTRADKVALPGTKVVRRWFVVEDANVAVLVDLSCVLTVAFAGVNVWITVNGDTEGPHKFFYETVPGAKFVFDQIRSAVRAWEDRPHQFLSGLWPGQVPPTARP